MTEFNEPNTKLIKAGKIRPAIIVCKCCGSEYEVELRADYGEGSSIVTIEKLGGVDTIAIYMHCDICGLHFKAYAYSDF